MCPDKGASCAALSPWYFGAGTAVRNPLWLACAQERASREGRERRHSASLPELGCENSPTEWGVTPVTEIQVNRIKGMNAT